jgi:hypothetical protein
MIKTLFAAAGALLTISPAFAQQAPMSAMLDMIDTDVSNDQFRSPEVAAQIRQANKSYDERGYLATAWSKQSDRLKTGGVQKFEVNMHVGEVMSVLAVCGKGCTDLDLRISDAAGNEVGADTGDDAIPIVGFTARTEGTYTVQVIMTACSAATCPIGVKAYQKK